MKFKKIAIIDTCRLTEEMVENLAEFSESPIIRFSDLPQTDDEIIARIDDADCVMVSMATNIGAAVLKVAPSLKFIAMCCSLYDAQSANVDIKTAEKLGIEVQGVRDYGDEGTVEFIFAELICLLKGLKGQQWRSEPTELTNKSMGIIGFGTLGQLVAKTAIHFGMKVFYYSRTRKADLENKDITYLALDELLQNCDIISTHVPKHTNLLGDREFKLKKKHSIFINTSLGLPGDKNALINWLAEDQTSFAIFDSDGAGKHKDELGKLPNTLVAEQSAGLTTESKERLSTKVLGNVREYLKGK